MAKNKVFYIGITVLVIVVVGGLPLSCKNKTAENETPTSATQSSSVPSGSNAGQTASGSKAEEAYVEMLAQTTYHTHTNNQNGWTAQNEKDLFAKYGVTKEEVDAFSKALRNNPAHAKAVTIKSLRRLQELQKTGK